MFPKWSDWDLQYTRKGLIKKQTQRALNILLFLSVIVAAYYLRQEGFSTFASLQNFKHVMQRYAKQGLLGLSVLVDRGITMLSS